MFMLAVGPDKLADLYTALQRALNTWEDAPTWLVELSDDIEKRKPAAPIDFELRPYQQAAMEALTCADTRVSMQWERANTGRNEEIGEGVHEAVRGEAPGGNLPDWPEDLTTFETRSAYQRGVADGRIGWQSVDTLTDPLGPSYRAMLTLRNLKFAIRMSATNKEAMIEAVDAAIHFVEEAQKLVPTPPADPLDTPLPCDITVGHGTHKKGVKLRSLVTRMQGLYDNAMQTASYAWVINEMADQVSCGRLFVSKIDVLSMTKDQFHAYVTGLVNEHRQRIEGLFPKR